MLKHYLQIIFRNLRRYKLVTFFNLAGLSISFASVIILAIYLWNEFSYDKSNENYKQIYMLKLHLIENGQTLEYNTLPNPLADLLQKNIPELQQLCSFAWGPQSYSKPSNPDKIYNLNTWGVDSTFTDIFTIKIKSGNSHPLQGKNKIIISEKVAKKIFGNENPVGKILISDNKIKYTVDAVFYDLPYNFSNRFEAYCSFPDYNWINLWSEYSFIHFYKIPESANIDTIYSKIRNIPFIKDNFLKDENINNNYKFELVPLKDLHFKEGSGNKLFVNTLLLVAVLLLFMALVNYINFAVANTRKLLKAAAIRQVSGETKASVFIVAVAETVILFLVSFIVAIVICYLALPQMQNIIGYPVVLTDYSLLLFVCMILFIVTGIVSALYPAKILTGMQPATALKGIVSKDVNKWTLGKIFTVVQYAISIILITGVLFIEKQISFIRNFDLGFDKENIIVISTTGSIQKQEKAFVNELLKNNNIIDYAYSQFVPGGVGMNWGRTIDGKYVSFVCWPVDQRYLNFMGFEIVKGRNFSDNIDADENNFIFNQTAIKQFDWQKDNIGKSIPGFSFKGKLIGIVKDMKYASLHSEVKPMAFWLTKTRHNELSLKISGKNVKQTVDYIKKVYSDFEKKYPIDYRFLDEQLDSLYKSEEKQASLILIFSIVSIFISFIGTLGLIIFITEYRVKEIGIRKVNGATINQILLMLNKSFIKKIFVAFVIALPVSYLSVKMWLQSFAYQTELSWWIFALSGLVIIIVSVITVTIQSYIAARKNPVEALRYE